MANPSKLLKDKKMEPIGAIAEGEWISLSGIYTAEEANFMAQLLSNSSDPSRGNGVFQSHFWPGNDQSLMNISPGENFYLSDSNPILQMDYHVHDEECLNREKSESVENRTTQSETFREEKDSQIESSKKRSWNSGEIQKSKRNVRSKKSQKGGSTSFNEDGNGGFNGQSTSSCCSDDDSNEELTSSSKGKTRANRGSATDPQSLYARKRRERINERLKILQTLVPNGTKVDISTMLEEAVHYVKFLQLQIKLLSSDDLWMYAPIAYNGMDIGLDLKLMTPKQS